MTETKERPLVGQNPAKRKAWTFQTAPAPALADLLAGGEARTRFLNHWLHENFRDGIDLAMFFAFRLLPARIVSDIGGFLGRFSVPRWHKGAQNRVRANLRQIRPDASEAQIDRWVAEFADSQGRQRAEYSVVQRMARNRRNIRFIGTEGLVQRCAGRPTIFIGLHTSNWEVMMQCLVDMGFSLTLNYDPPQRRSHHWIVRYVRRRGGLGLFKPGKSAVRPALRMLEGGGNVLIFCDEGFNGKLRGPFFGRRLHLQGNYALVARLARKTSALLCPVYMIREGGTRFALHALDPFELPPEEAPGNRLAEDVILLNSVVEPVIAAHPGQWFFIDNRIVPL